MFVRIQGIDSHHRDLGRGRHGRFLSQPKSVVCSFRAYLGSTAELERIPCPHDARRLAENMRLKFGHQVYGIQEEARDPDARPLGEGPLQVALDHEKSVTATVVAT